MELKNIIKKYREEHNMSLRDFAQRCDLSYSYIGMLEKRVFKNENGIILQPLNNKYQPMPYSNEEIEKLPVKILGVYEELRRKKEKNKITCSPTKVCMLSIQKLLVQAVFFCKCNMLYYICEKSLKLLKNQQKFVARGLILSL